MRSKEERLNEKEGMLKEKEIAEDDSRSAQEKVQQATDAGIAEVDAILKAKEADIMTV